MQTPDRATRGALTTSIFTADLLRIRGTGDGRAPALRLARGIPGEVPAPGKVVPHAGEAAPSFGMRTIPLREGDASPSDFVLHIGPNIRKGHARGRLSGSECTVAPIGGLSGRIGAFGNAARSRGDVPVSRPRRHPHPNWRSDCPRRSRHGEFRAG
jgi:hypothetical protein